ncbi:MAG: hypothetical protein K5778_08125 [Bacteroidaceae bacterium]|nr:hypothetical protein [Bacteroidaceae bacterium]
MDYKYIEQLLDRYWECHTTAEEEQILRSFFSQHDLPQHLAQYAPLFDFVREEQQMHVSDDFDSRFGQLLAVEDEQQAMRRTHARRLTLSRRVAPLLKAAAVVAVIFTIGTATERAIVGSHSDDNATQPVLTDTYVRSSEVEAVIQPEHTTDATATIQNTDTLAHAVLPVEPAVENE